MRPRRPSIQRSGLRWPRLALTMVLLLTGFYFAWKYIPFRVDDGFIAFEPEASLFPDAPVGDAHTVAGIGRPDGWPDDRILCPYDADPYFSDSQFGNDWHTVRHDWTDNGSDKAWIVSERTIGYRSLRDFDRVAEGFRDRTKYCGWQFGDGLPSYNSIWTELDGLPDGGVAFTIDVSPRAVDRSMMAESDPANFRGLGAFLPGRKRGQVMYLMWVAWGTDIPRDQFVEAANTLYDAAHRSSNKDDEDFGADKKIEYEFTEFDPAAAGVPQIVDPLAEVIEYPGGLRSRRCRRRSRSVEIWDSSSAEDYQAERGVTSDTSLVYFGASRWPQRTDYLRAKRRSLEAVQTKCIDSYQPRAMLIEPIDLPGLPEGAFASKWTEEGDAYVVVIVDDDKQMLMIVSWLEGPGPAPEDKFVEVVNRAWDKFQADNP